MDFFNNTVTVLQTLVIALGTGLGIWGVINLLEDYVNDNPGVKLRASNLQCSEAAGYFVTLRFGRR